MISVKRERLLALAGQFSRLRIAVLGDLFLDKWLTIEPKWNEPSVETGLTAYQVVNARAYAGAAGTVLNNLSALGVKVPMAVGFVGADGDGWELLRALKGQSIDTRYVVTSKSRITPTYMKPMFRKEAGCLEEGNRFDFKNHSVTPNGLEHKLIQNIRAAARDADAVIVLDQLAEENNGVVTHALREEIAKLSHTHSEKIFYADSRSFIHLFRNVIIKCNHLEAARMALGREPGGFSKEDVLSSMEKLQRLTGNRVFITCGEHGIACGTAGERSLVPAAKQSGPIDICGAGDACTAGIVSALCAGAGEEEAAFIGNLTAGVTVRKLGTTGTASREEILALYDEQFGEA